MPEKIVETGMSCPHCLAGGDVKVVAVVEVQSSGGDWLIGQRRTFPLEVSTLHCPTCKTLFHDPELCQKINNDLAEQQRKAEDEELRKKVEKDFDALEKSDT